MAAKNAKSSQAKRRSGQAIVELLPAAIIFMTLIMGGLSYYFVMRSAVEREQTARNLLWAKIANSGTLTTPPEQLQEFSNPDEFSASEAVDDVQLGGGLGMKNVFIGTSTSCIVAIPGEPLFKTPFGAFEGLAFLTKKSADKLRVQIKSYAVIHRDSSPGSCP